MVDCLSDLHLSYCVIYLRDIIIYSKMPSEHIMRLRGVFEKLAEAGLKLKHSNYGFFCTRLAYLGHIICAKGIETDSKKLPSKTGPPHHCHQCTQLARVHQSLQIVHS